MSDSAKDAQQEIWTCIAHKDGRWAAIIAAQKVPLKDLTDFIGRHTLLGREIMMTRSREEHSEAIDKLKMWDDR